MEYIFILLCVLLISPIVILLASSQNKKTKNYLKLTFLSFLLLQLILGFFNWEFFKNPGRSGFELALTYPQSFLGFFFIIILIQIFLLFFYQKFYTLAVILNFINTFVFFTGMIRLGQVTGTQATGFASIGAAFTALIGNVIGLTFINKDRNILNKYFR